MNLHVTPILQVSNLGLRRSERWLFKQLSFELQAGEVIQVTGRNGAGKTSLLRCVCDLLPQQEGEVHWQVHEDMQVIPLYIGHLAALKTELTVMENLQYHPINGKFPDDGAIEQALFEVGLGLYMDRMGRHLSAGQTRRVGLARLLLADSRCWVLDEPFTALDVKACQWLEGVITNFVKQGGAVLLTSHQPVSLGVELKTLEIKDNGEGHV